jgi:DNA-binding response OmpR family regulator
MTVPSLAGRSILIIEDEALIALDLACAFEVAGADVTSTNTVHHASVLVRHDGLSAAVVDHALPDGDTHDICRCLQERNVPFVVYSGFNSNVVLGGAKAVYISKPNTPELVVAAVEKLLQSGATFGTSHAPQEGVGDRV